MIGKLAAAAIGLTLCVGCMHKAGGGSVATKAVPASALNRDRIVKATGRKDIVLVEVPASKGAARETMVKALSLPFGEASVPSALGARLKQVHDEGSPAYVGGASPEKTEWALREALIHVQPKSLPGLIVYTDAPLTSGLMEAGRQAGASVLHSAP